MELHQYIPPKPSPPPKINPCMARSKRMKGLSTEDLIPGYPTKGYILHGKDVVSLAIFGNSFLFLNLRSWWWVLEMMLFCYVFLVSESVLLMDFYVIRLISLSAVLGTVSGHLMCVCSHRKRERGRRERFDVCVQSQREREEREGEEKERKRSKLWINAVLVLIESIGI